MERGLYDVGRNAQHSTSSAHFIVRPFGRVRTGLLRIVRPLRLRRDIYLNALLRTRDLVLKPPADNIRNHPVDELMHQWVIYIYRTYGPILPPLSVVHDPHGHK